MQSSMFNKQVPLAGRDDIFLMNTFTDAQLVVSRDVVNLLDRVGTTPDLPATLSTPERSALRELTEHGFIVKDRATEWEALDRFFHDVREDTSELRLTALTTLQCNFACDYCVQGDHDDYNANAEKMSLDTARRLCEWVELKLVRDRAVMGAQQPAFEQRHDLMHMGHELSRRLCVATEHGHLMLVAMMLQRVVAGPAISVHEAVRCDGVLNKRRQAGPGGVEETAQPDAAQSAALDFHRNYNQRLGFRLPPAPARVHARHIGLVHFDPAGEAIAARTHHRPTKLVEPRPGGLVAAQTQRPLQPQGAHPRLLVRHPPHRSEPRHQRRPRVLEDRAGGHRRLVGAGRALPPPSSHGPRLRRPTARAPKPLRPPELLQIRATGLFGRESPLELREIPRIILHEAVRYMLGLPESSK